MVSISYGFFESSFTQSDLTAIDQSLQLLTETEHITVFVASGDCGAFDSFQYNTLAVDYPGVSPWAVDVGGTELTVDANNNRSSEVVWSDGSNQTTCGNNWGSGGGNSTLYQRPDWQKGDGVDNQYAQGNRQVPDIAAIAYHIPVYVGGQWTVSGGTSAAAPIWATGMVLVNQGLLAQVQSYLAGPSLFYQVANNKNTLVPYNDITQGDNLHFPATPGWDYATGLGTPNLADFYNVLSALVKQAS